MDILISRLIATREGLFDESNSTTKKIDMAFVLIVLFLLATVSLCFAAFLAIETYRYATAQECKTIKRVK
jgi:Na+-transporting methylmalonyl-CoA/oxaloacetate decarboxylase gamma subunit